MQTSGESAAHLAPSKRKRKGKRVKKAKRDYRLSEEAPDDAADFLVGRNAPSELRALVNGIVRTCQASGGDRDGCHEKAVLGVRNQGWDYNLSDDSWIKGKPRTVTFAERAEGRTVATYYMHDREIMQPGTWKGRTYTVDDLRSIAEGTNAVLSQLRPPMVAEHPTLGPAKRAAAVGWPKGLYVDKAGSLRAKAIKGIRADAAKVIEFGGYSDFSVGLRSYTDQQTGKHYPLVLDHLALTNFPVIKTMEGTSAGYEEPAVLAASEGDVEVITFCALRDAGQQREEQEMADQSVAELVKAAIAEVKAGYETQLSELKGTIEATLSESQARNKALEADVVKLRAEGAESRKAQRRDAALAFIDANVKSGRITAAQRPYETALALVLSEIPEDEVVTLSEGEKSIEVHPFDVYKTTVSKRVAPIRVGLGEQATRGARDGDSVVSAFLSETALVAAGHSAEDAKRVVEAEKSGNLVVTLGPGLA